MTEPHTPLRIPDHMSRADIGAYMRELRLHYGLTEADVSERLHIRVRYVGAIESANFEAMPGRAYARGYLHTYAEFLGLDADQVVERCFGPELSREAQAHTVPDAGRRGSGRRWGALLVVVLLGGLGYLLFFSHPVDDGSVEVAVGSGVEAVPESMLAQTRTLVMPDAERYDCLGAQTHLGCYHAQHLTRAWLVKPAVADMAPAPGDARAVEPEPVQKAPEKPAEKKAEAPKAKTPAADTKATQPKPAAEAAKEDKKKEDAPKQEEPEAEESAQQKKADAGDEQE